MLKILVIDGLIMSTESLKTLAGILSIPVDFDALRFRISKTISYVLISLNLNVDSDVEEKLFAGPRQANHQFQKQVLLQC